MESPPLAPSTTAEMLSTVSFFVRSLGAFSAFAPPSQAARVQQYANKAANLLEVAGASALAFAKARAKLQSDAQTMKQWVDVGYEPTDADFDALEGRIDELHERFVQAKSNQTPTPSS